MAKKSSSTVHEGPSPTVQKKKGEQSPREAAELERQLAERESRRRSEKPAGKPETKKPAGKPETERGSAEHGEGVRKNE